MEPNKCCNQTPSVIVVTDYMSDNILGYYVACDDCGHQSRLTLTKDDAIAVWNEEEEN